MNLIKTEWVETYCRALQETIIKKLISIDPTVHQQTDTWQREEGGGGCSMAISNGQIFEKGGVNFSCVEGNSMPSSATVLRPELSGCSFKAMGVSLVLHSLNPYVPATHCNIRFFLATKKNQPPVWWFGGGFDLTPYYGFAEDCVHWHQTAKNACDPFGEEIYPRYKKWCDEYFYLKHRQENRGIGGLFFDDLNEWGFDKSFSFVQSVGDHFLPAYIPLVEKRKNHPYGLLEKNFQQFRRARYVEFNLVYDRGTLFGLQSGGRTESILISMPPQANWAYNWVSEENTPEAKLTNDYLNSKEWL